MHSWVQLCFLLFVSTKAGRADLFLYFKLSVLVLCRNSLFGSCVVNNSEFDAYQAVDRSYYLPYLEPGLKPSFSIHTSISLCLLLLNLAICKFVINFPQLKNECNQHQSGIIKLYPLLQTCAYIGFCSYIFLFVCFYPWPYILNVQTSSRKIVDIFSIAVHVLGNLFWKICPLFGQILITCLKCSRASFSTSSYNEKICWGRDWKI